MPLRLTVWKCCALMIAHMIFMWSINNIFQPNWSLSINFQLTKKNKSKIVIVPFQVAERSGVQFKLSHSGDQWIFSWPRALSVHFVDCRQKTLFLALITQFNIPFSLFLRKSSEVFEDFFVERRSFACRNWSLNVLLFYCNWKNEVWKS